MDTDEELYDSLDEDFSNVYRDYSTNCSAKNVCDVTSVVPLYDGEILKYSIQTNQHVSRKKFKSKIPRLAKNIPSSLSCSGKSDARNEHACNRRKTKPIQRTPEQKSYVNMFHAKIGYPEHGSKIPPKDTTRAIDGDSTHRTASTDSASYIDANSVISINSEKFYMEQMEIEKTVPPLNLTCGTSCVMLKSDFNICKTFKSTTQHNLSQYPKPKSYKKFPIIVPTLGGLGPDIVGAQEKMQRLRKQKAYGQHASDKNRLKMLEGKILNNLEEATKSSNVINKKIENKCASVLQ